MGLTQGPEAPTFTIVSGDKKSVAQAISPSATLVLLLIPAAFQGTAITFEVSINGQLFMPVINASDGTDYSITVAAGKATAIPPAALCGCSWIRLVAGTTQTSNVSILATIRDV